VTVTVPAGTTITRNDPASLSELKAGSTIAVRGTTGTDGSTTASSITINPANGGAGGLGGPRTSGVPGTTTP
jgi:hypothetical protein